MAFLKKWGIRGLHIKDAFLQADGFGHEVFLRAPAAWDPESTHRVRKLRAPAYGLNAAPAPFHGALQRYLLSSAGSLGRVGL